MPKDSDERLGEPVSLPDFVMPNDDIKYDDLRQKDKNTRLLPDLSET